jgi:ABC-type polysaccharide/polyol phosphate transport system ATPase subunit
MSDDVLVRVENVSKRFCRSLKRSLWYGLQDLGSELGGRRHGGGGGLAQSSADVDLRKNEFWAVKDVSFELRRGECLGLIGHNGAGKTTLLKILTGLIKPDAGSITIRGRVAALIALGAGFNPILTGRENIYINASVLGLAKREIDARIDEIIDFSEIGTFIDSPVQNYSSGMQVRLGFAIASSLEPEVLILDEVLAVGDARFQAKCINRITGMFERCCVIFVSHQAHIVQMICNRALWMKSGAMVESGLTSNILQSYLVSSDNLTDAAASGVHLAPEVLSVSLEVEKPHFELGESLCTRMHANFSCPINLGNMLFCLVDNSGRYVARGTSDLSGENTVTGSVSIRLCLQNLRLAVGPYKIQILCFSQQPARQLINYTHPQLVLSKSPIVSDTKYQPNATYELFSKI